MAEISTDRYRKIEIDSPVQENNAVEWREEMCNRTTGLYGTTGMFFYLNRSYKHPLPQLKDYYPAYVALVVAANPVADADGDEDYGSGYEEYSGDDSTVQEETEGPVVNVEQFLKKFINKLREGAYDRRQSAIELRQ